MNMPMAGSNPEKMVVNHGISTFATIFMPGIARSWIANPGVKPGGQFVVLA